MDTGPWALDEFSALQARPKTGLAEMSRPASNGRRALVTVAPVTTRIRSIPAEVSLGPEDGLPRDCVANLDTIITIAKESLQTRIASLRSEKMQAVDAAIRFALGLE